MSVAEIFDQTTPYVSGYSIRSLAITRALTKLGVPLRIFSSPIFSYQAAIEEYEGVLHTRAQIKQWAIIKRIPFLKEVLIVSAIRKTLTMHWHEDIKCLHAHSSVLNGMAALKIARQKSVPFIYEIRAFWEDAAVDQGKTKEGGWRYKFTRTLETDVARQADKVTVICEGLKKDLVGRGIAEKNITVIPNGVDVNEFHPPQGKDRELEAKLNLRDCRIIGFIGTFFRFEGLELLIRATKHIINRRKDVKFLLVGGGEREEELKKMVRELGLKEKIIFSGRVKHKDVQRYYSLVDILVYPRISKRITELVTPLKPLEAMALKKIIIASDAGGIKELIRNNYNGILFEKENVNDLADKCLYVLDHFEELKKMGENGRHFVETERNWAEICKGYLPLLKQLGAIA